MPTINLSPAATWKQLEESLKNSPGANQVIHAANESQVSDLIKNKLQEICHTEKPEEVQSIFDQVLIESKSDSRLLNNADTVRQIFDTINDKNFIEASGSIPQIFDDQAVLDSAGTPQADAKNIVKILLGTAINPKMVLTKDLIKAGLFQKDPARMGALLNELQEVGRVMVEKHLSPNATEPVSEDQKKLIEIFFAVDPVNGVLNKIGVGA